MNNLFNPDNKFMQLGFKLFDLISLQIAVVLFSLPIVTAGAAFTAMHKVLLQIYRDQSSSIWKEFFTSFRENFKQATILWISFLTICCFICIDFFLIMVTAPSWISYLLLILGGYLLLAGSWIFIFQSRYHNTVIQTIKNASKMILLHPLYTVLNAGIMLSPIVVLMVTYKAIPVILLLGCTLPGILRASIYSRIFDTLENMNGRDSKEQQSE